MLSVQTNVSAISAQRHLGATSDNLATSMERLSSGFRINRAADDAAGLAVSEKLKAQIGGLNQASRNARDGISMIQTAEGALSEVQSMMQRMRDLAVQAASDTNSQTERQNINLELGQLQSEIDSISKRTKFNGQGLLDGSLSSKQGVLGVTGTVELTAGAAVGSNGAVVGVDVSGAKAGMTYEFDVDTTNHRLILNEYTSAGVTTGLHQDLDIPATIAAGTSQTFDFSEFGIKVTIAASSAGAVAQSDIEGGFPLASGIVIDTAAGNGDAVIQTGANKDEATTVSFVDTQMTGSEVKMTALNTALNNFASSVDPTTGNATTARDNAGKLITALDTALGYISSSRAVLGAAQNRLQHTIANLSTTSENLSASNSRIRDVDVATESSNMAMNQVLEQAGVSVLAQANQLPQLALKLLG